jgi:hypothetical protein
VSEYVAKVNGVGLNKLRSVLTRCNNIYHIIYVNLMPANVHKSIIVEAWPAWGVDYISYMY